MIVGHYDGLHYLDLVESYRRVAWSAAWGDVMQRQEDPVYECLSHFHAACRRAGLRLLGIDHPLAQRTIDLVEGTQPQVFLVSARHRYLPKHRMALERVIPIVQSGSNLAVIYSSMMHQCYPREYDELLQVLDITPGEAETWSVERQSFSFGRGRLFFLDNNVVSDARIEGGPFGADDDSEDGRERMQAELEEIGRDISTFDVPCVDCTLAPPAPSWPLGENLYAELVIQSRSRVPTGPFQVAVALDESFEPLFSLYTHVPQLAPGEELRTQVVLRPTRKGVFRDPIRVRVIGSGQSYPALQPSTTIEIRDTLHNLLKSIGSPSVDFPTVLPRHERLLQPRTNSTTLLRLLQQDPNSLIGTARSVGEHLCRLIVRRQNLSPAKGEFFHFISALAESGVISQDATGWIHTVRKRGNDALHGVNGKPVSCSYDDALTVLAALVQFLEEVARKELL